MSRYSCDRCGCSCHEKCRARTEASYKDVLAVAESANNDAIVLLSILQERIERDRKSAEFARTLLKTLILLGVTLTILGVVSFTVIVIRGKADASHRTSAPELTDFDAADDF